MEQRESIERALATAETVVPQVPVDVFDRATTCSEWNVEQLLQHLLADTLNLAARLSGSTPSFKAPPGALPDRDLLEGHPPEAFARAAAELRVAAKDDAALAREAVLQGALTTDIYVHSWDLARATGVSFPEDDELAAYLLGFVTKGITPDNRSPAFAEAIEAPAGSSTTDKLVAFLGRDPAA